MGQVRVHVLNLLTCNERDSYSLNIVCLTYVYVMCMVTAERGNFVVSLVPEIL